MADVFISYHEASAGELAETIAERLDNAGISCWCARRDMPFGGDFAREIPPQIDSCKVFLLLLNENVYASDHIENEVGLAFGRRNAKENITILPLEIGDFQRKSWIRYYLIHTQSVKFPENPDEQRIQGLVERVAKLLGKESAKIIKRGKCGDNATYTLLENGVLLISGMGSMLNFKWNGENYSTPWWDKHEMISYVHIQDVITIGDGAFRDCSGLIKVHIPDSVSIIGDNAFNGCTGLTSLTIPNSVTHIGWWAFYDCTGLTSVTIPDSVTVIANAAFSGCAGLTSITIPDSVTCIEAWAFWNCIKLISVSVPAKADIHSTAFPAHVRVIRRR